MSQLVLAERAQLQQAAVSLYESGGRRPSLRNLRRLLQQVTDRLGLSARSYTRLLKVGRTIADLAGNADIGPVHLAEAIHYRGLDRKTN